MTGYINIQYSDLVFLCSSISLISSCSNKAQWELFVIEAVAGVQGNNSLLCGWVLIALTLVSDLVQLWLVDFISYDSLFWVMTK